MTTITLNADERLIAAAQERARANHTTLDAEFQRWLESYAGEQERLHRVEEAMSVVRQLQEKYHTGGRKFTRDEMNER